MDKILILLGILFGSILVVENSIFAIPAYVFFWNKSAGFLALICIGIGVLIGYGVRGLVSNDAVDIEDDF